MGDVKNNIVLVFVLCMVSLSACGNAGQPGREDVTVKETVMAEDSGSMSLNAVYDDKVDRELDSSMKKPDVSAFTDEYTEEGEPDIYDEVHGYREDMSDEEPEGADTYEIDEAPPYYRVNVYNMEVMSDVYNDLTNCNLLRLAFQTYFDIATEEPGESYDISLIQGTCKDDGSILTLQAEALQFPGTVFYIEYDKNEKQFGIDSELLDATLATMRENR